MKDLFDILAEFSKRYPTLQWPMVFAICATIVLVWKTIEELVPKAITFLVNHFRQKFSSRKSYSEQETVVRSFVEKTQTLNWLSCIKSLSKYHLTAAIEDIYFPLRYKVVSGKQQYTSTVIERILYDNRAFAIIGSPGSGKSTVLSKIAIVYAKDTVEETFGIKESRLPLFLNLKTLPHSLGPLPKILTDVLRSAGCDLQENFLYDQLKHKRCIVLLDGLDETGDDLRRREITEWIATSIAAFPENRFIVTCRNVEWDLVNIPNMPYACLQSLSDYEVDGIIKKWDQHLMAKESSLQSRMGDEIDGLCKILSRVANLNLMNLARNPLLLTIMIILKISGVNIPARKVEAYNVFVRTLLGEWEEIKNLRRDLTGIRLQKRMKLFQKLSLFLLENPALKEMIDLKDAGLASFLRQQLMNIFQEDIGIPIFLDDIVTRTGLLYKNTDEVFLFSNRGFLEFLAAKELADNLEYNKVYQHILKDNWRETIIQFISFLADPTPLIKTIVEDSDERYDLPYAILANGLLEAVAVDNALRHKGIVLINEHILKNLVVGKIDVDLIKNAYALNPNFWLEMMSKVLVKSSSLPLEPAVASDILSFLDDSETLSCLKKMADVSEMDLKRDILRSLRLATSSQAIDILWSFTNEDSLKETIIESLVAKGDLIINSCTEVLKKTTSTELTKDVACSVLCRINNPFVLKTIGHFMKSASPSLHEYIVSELHQTYLSKYKLKEAEKVAEIMRDVFVPSFYARSMKKYLEMLLIVITLFFIFPILIFFSLAIKLDSPGPILYRQRRVGLNGKEFHLYKFRTMTVDTDESVAGSVSKNDPRITRIGRILRSTHVEEIPQLFNMLRGEIGLIGPRPERPEFVEMVLGEIPHYLLRYNMKPGMTGLEQVNDIVDSVEYPRQKLVYDLYYISNCTFLLDLSIFARTLLLTIPTYSDIKTYLSNRKANRRTDHKDNNENSTS